MTQTDALSIERTTLTRATKAGVGFAENSVSRFHYLLTGYWLIFWLLNGLDKFFNEPTFFGVTRDAKFVDYFGNIGLPEPVAMFALYGIGVYELALGVLFFLALLYLDRFKTLILTGLELSLGVFVVFSLGDILFGDRRELWEHGCYIFLVTVSYLVAQRHLSLSMEQGR